MNSCTIFVCNSVAKLLIKLLLLCIRKINYMMKMISILLKRYVLTLLTLILILFLTFYKPMGLEHKSMPVGTDKLVHFAMYFMLCAVFWYENFKITMKPGRVFMAIFAVIVPILFSGLMEYLQYLLTSYRTGDLEDFVYNTAGVVAALFFSLFVTRPCMAKRSRN